MYNEIVHLNNCSNERRKKEAEKVSELRQDDEMLFDLADLFRLFADSTRVRVLNELRKKELGVTDLANELGMTTSAISHQLRLLKQARLVKSRRDGKLIYYSLDDDHVKTIIEMGKEHIGE